MDLLDLMVRIGVDDQASSKVEGITSGAIARGVAMGNAQPPVKAAANYLTADNDHDGVGLAVEKFILNEET